MEALFHGARVYSALMAALSVVVGDANWHQMDSSFRKHVRALKWLRTEVLFRAGEE